MNSPRLPPLGNKPLPKISYGKLNKKPAPRTSKQNANDQSNVAGNGKSDKEHIKSQSSTFLMPSGEQQNTGSSFPRFAVLPPIPGRRRSVRGGQASLILPNSCTNDNWPNGTLNEQSTYFGNVVGDKRRGSGFVASSQRRASSINHDFVSTRQVGHNDLEIVGSALGSKIQSRKDKDRQSFNTAGNTSPTSGESTGVYARDHASKNRGKPVAPDGRTNVNWVGDEPPFPRKGRKSCKALNIQRHNSGIANKSSFLSANDAMDVSTNSNRLSLSLPQSTARPLSRGQISFHGFEDGELLKGNQQTSAQERRKSFGRLGISMPVIQIDGATEVNNNNSCNDNVGARETASMSQAATNWQLLIDSLESAKDEVPKQSIGVPYTSVREKRRRSALCRNNSKQVDDFLLVHNLRDLGLL